MPKIKKVIDLSMSIEDGMRLFPGMANPLFTRLKTHPKQGVQVTKLEINVHGGTHVDAMRHFLKNGKSINEIPISALIGDAIIFDLTSKSPNEIIKAEDFKQYGRKVRSGNVVIIRTDWALNKDPNQYCTLDRGAAEWLVAHQIQCLGMDMPSPDPPSGKDVIASKESHPAHHTILGAGIPIVESLVNLGSLPDESIFFCCLPLKIKNSEAALARAVAIEFE